MRTLQFLTAVFYMLFLTLELSAHPSWGIVVDKQRNIYFADLTHHGMGAVWKFSHTGKLDLLLENFHAHNVNLDTSGRVVSAHGEGTHTMIRLEKNGIADTLYHTRRIEDFFGGCAAYGPDGSIYYQIANRIWQIDQKGEKKEFHPFHLEWTQSLFVDSDGSVLVPEIGEGNGDIYRLYPDGRHEKLAENLITKLDRPRDKHNDVLLGITVGCDSLVYIAELAGRRIIQISDDGPVTFYESPEGWIPTGIDFFSGDAYILEFSDPHGKAGPQLVKINEAGEKSILFNHEEYHETGETSDDEEPQSARPFGFYLIAGLLLLVVMMFIRQLFTKK